MAKPQSNCAEHVAGEAQRARAKRDVDAVAAEHLLGSHALGLGARDSRQPLTQ